MPYHCARHSSIINRQSSIITYDGQTEPEGSVAVSREGFKLVLSPGVGGVSLQNRKSRVESHHRALFGSVRFGLV